MTNEEKTVVRKLIAELAAIVRVWENGWKVGSVLICLCLAVCFLAPRSVEQPTLQPTNDNQQNAKEIHSPIRLYGHHGKFGDVYTALAIFTAYGKPEGF